MAAITSDSQATVNQTNVKNTGNYSIEYENIYINLPNNETSCNINIYDINGRIILSKSISTTFSKLDISKLNKRIYYIKFIGLNTSEIKKLIIN